MLSFQNEKGQGRLFTRFLASSRLILLAPSAPSSTQKQKSIERVSQFVCTFNVYMQKLHYVKHKRQKVYFLHLAGNMAKLRCYHGGV
jgi:hypothetical protein